MREEFDTVERAQLANLQSALLAAMDTLSLPQVVALLAVALEPGLSINDLADRTGLTQQSASRHASVLLGRQQNWLYTKLPEPFMKQEINSDDPRKRALFLTSKGYDSISKMVQR